MSHTPPTSLRDLYNPPIPSWSFEVPASSSSPSSSPFTSRAAPAATTTTTPSYRFPASSTSARATPDVGAMLQALVMAALGQYGSTAVAMPFEVGKLLLQVQWVPREASAALAEEEAEEEDDGDGDGDGEMSDASSHDNEHSYFTDPGGASSSLGSPPRARHGRTLRQADEHGYIVRRSVLEESTRPEYVIPVGSANGAWGMVKRIVRFKGEGWLALWKGLFTSFVTEVLRTNLQPISSHVLQSVFFPSAPFHEPPLLLQVSSHLVTDLILSPLDLIRARLVVQSSMPRHRTYSGPLDAASKILRQEGGLRGMYLHPHLLYPVILDGTLRPLISLAVPRLLLPRLEGVLNPEMHPFLFMFADLAFRCAGFLVTLPIETVRRRLQVQTRGSAKPIKTCVETRPAPYHGVVDALWRILTEERSDLPLKRRVRRKRKGKGQDVLEDDEAEREPSGWFARTGLGQLYRGLGVRLGAGIVVYLAQSFGGEEMDGGWAEL